MPTTLITAKEAMRRCCISRTAMFEQIAAGSFPKPLHLPERRIAFVEQEVEDHLAHLISQRNPSENAHA